MQDFLKANYHAHTVSCQHAYGTEREYIEAAIEMGMKEFGFSDHVPCPFKDGYVSGIRMTMKQTPEYVETIRRLAEEYKNEITIYVGFEAEYIPEFHEEQMRMFRNLGCDYMIMGQHFLESEQYGPYTGTETEDESRIRDYVDAVIEGMKTGDFLYLAHPDIMNYRGLDSVYEWEMTRLCKALKEMDIPLEINMLGRAENAKHYPAERFWKIAGEVGNYAVIGEDAHCVEHIKNEDAYKKCMELVEKYHIHLLDELKIK